MGHRTVPVVVAEVELFEVRVGLECRWHGRPVQVAEMVAREVKIVETGVLSLECSARQRSRPLKQH